MRQTRQELSRKRTQELLLMAAFEKLIDGSYKVKSITPVVSGKNTIDVVVTLKRTKK